MNVTYIVAEVPPEVTRPLRQRLLKPNNTFDELAQSDGEYPDAGYYAAIDDSGCAVSVASARPEAPPWPHRSLYPWRVRGVATVEELRGQGVATTVMRAVLQHIRAHGGDFAWLNGRTPARPFYQHLGFTQHGGEWDDPESGPHLTMAQRLLGTQ